AWIVLNQRDEIFDVFGQGVTFHYKLYDELSVKNRTPKTGREQSLGYRAVEQDFLDLYGLYGAPLTLFILAFHLYFWLLSLRLYLTRRTIEYFGCFIALTLFLFHGLIAGHALISAQVCTLIGSIYAYVQFRLRHPANEDNA
ncbi:MAG: hypothetical protein MJK04_05455, partial [Psychrosphaera sp.]|nr:hypothetical protein [Psychrosphaera sp.]